METGARAAASGRTKHCILCAEMIPLEAEHCPFCPAVYTITIQGYCKQCHAVRAASPDSVCLTCGGKVEDLQILSVYKGEAPIPKPAAVAAASPPIPVATEFYQPPLAAGLKPAKAPASEPKAAGAEKKQIRKLPRWAWALIAGGIVLVVGIAVGVTLFLTVGQGPLAGYNSWRTVFTDTFDSNENHWQLGEWSDVSGRGSSQIAGGVLHIYAWAGGPSAPILDIPYQVSVSDFYLSVDFKQVGGSKTGDASSGGIIFHYLSDHTYFYIFEVRPNQQANLAISRQGEYQIIEGPYAVPSYRPGEYNRLVIVSEHSTIRAYLNDELVLTKVDDSLPTGKLAFQAWLQYYNDKADFYIDNLEIRVP